VKVKAASAQLFSGNEALGEAAIRAGCDCYYGYPITPQNELTAYMSARMPEEGRVFLQAESELAAINMVFGSSSCGMRAMTSSSSPGISLKQEGISYLAGAELPAVIVNIARGGPGLGNISGAQGDYWQAVKGGGHGDYRTPVLAPASVQETVDLTGLAFDLADRYRTPVLILGDGYLGQMMEPVTFGDLSPASDLPAKDWALSGASGRPARLIRSLFMEGDSLEEHNLMLLERYKLIEEKETRWEGVDADGADVVMVAYGIPARICRSVIAEGAKRGMKLGMIRPISLWPFPAEPIRRAAERVKGVLVVEMSTGQMVEDVRLSVEGRCPVGLYGRTGGRLPKTDVILEECAKLAGK